MSNLLTVQFAGLSQEDIQALIAAAQPDNPGEGYVRIAHEFPDSVGQGNWLTSVDSTYFKGGYVNNTPPAQGDNLSYKAFLAAGTYKLKLMSAKTSNQGIFKFLIDDVEVAQHDMYNGSLVKNQVFTTANIIIATSGIKTLKVLCNTKNASSSNYQLIIQSLALYRTA